MSNLTIIIPHYNKDGYRARNLEYSTQYYRKLLPDARIIVIEQKGDNNHERIECVNLHEIIDCGSTFHKAKLINTVVYEHTPDSEYIAIVDNDCIAPMECFADYQTILETASAYLPYGAINYLNEGLTRVVIRNGLTHTITSKTQPMSISKYTGGVVIFKKSTFETVCGIDEYFIDWGGEDDAFLAKCIRKVGVVIRASEDRELMHLYHTPFHRNNHFSNDIFIKNKKAVACINRMNDEDFLEYTKSYSKTQRDQFTNLIAKYESLNELNVIVTAKFGVGSIKFDSTAYNIPCIRKDEADIEVVLSIVMKDDGIERTTAFIRGILDAYPNLSNEDRKRFQKFSLEPITII